MTAPVTPTPAPTPTVIPKLPNWFSPGSVAIFLGALVAFVGGFLVALHPGWTEPAGVVAAVPSAALLIATGAVAFVVVTHRRAQAAIAAAGGHALLPTWTDPASVTSFLASVLSAVFAVVTVFAPSAHEPVAVQAILPSVGVLVAIVAQGVNTATHHAVTVAAAKARLARA